MSDTSWQEILDLFEQVVELPPGERPAFLARVCDDEGTLQALEELLAVHDDEEGSHLAPERTTDPTEPSAELPTDRIGNYRLIRQVGQGGMSTVYLASRDDDAFHRHVVIKLVRQGMEREAILARLRIERQILAGLDHPYVARLFDGGSTDEGLPYFVMEYVDGSPIDAYCDENQLSVAERLQLFRKVCVAVQYAHRNLVVHRDIKPSNILVTKDGTPKLLDFGIAKLLDPDVASTENEPTAAWHRILTPSYASPEQLTGRQITTASDVYSLGVLLYKLLTGRLPRRVDGRSLHELESDLLKSEPLAPSDAADDGGYDRGYDGQQLRGDLDAVVLRALRTEPAQRYGSVGQLVNDLQRFEDGRPVTAREGGWRYRAGKFVRRNRVGVAAAALLAMLLAGFVTAIAWQSVRVAEERDQARKERDEKEAVLALLLDVFRSSHPYVRPGEDLTVRDALQRSVPVLESGLLEQPLVRAALLHASGAILSVIGESQPAIRQLEEALEIRREIHGESHADVLATRLHLAEAIVNLGQLDEAEEMTLRTIELAREQGDEANSSLVEGLVQIAAISCYRSDYQAAEGPSQEALELVESLPKSRPQAILAQEYLAMVRNSQGRYEEAASLYSDAQQQRRQHYGEGHPSLIEGMSNLGLAQRRLNQFDDAIATFQRVRSLELQSYGEDYENPTTFSSLAGAYFGQEDYERAIETYEEAVGVAIRTRGPEDWRVLLYTTRIEQARLRLGHPEEAEETLRELLEVWRPRLGDDHSRIAQTESALGESLSVQGRCEEAHSLLVDAFERLIGTKHRLRSDTFEILRDHLRRCGRESEIGVYQAMLEE